MFRVLVPIALVLVALSFDTARAKNEPLKDHDQESDREVVTVEADELPSAYGSTPDVSHGRISTLTKAYVLAPFHFELEAGYDGAVFRHGAPLHLFQQEVEVGLPGRFTVGAQNSVEHSTGNTRERSVGIEGRYALANWNKIPLNPAISAEYHFGLGSASRDSGELALLLTHDFPNLIEWALDIFIEREFRGGNSVGAGFAQSIEFPIILPEEQLETGIEMQYRSEGDRTGRRAAAKGFGVGPTLAWRPTKDMRFDLSPLIGCGGHAPTIEVFAVFSYSFGVSDDTDSDAPASARGH